MLRLEAIHELAAPGGRIVRALEAGDADGRTVVFFGGLGTSLGAYLLTELACSDEERAGLRVVSVERNGFGETPFTPGLGFDDAVDDVLLVLAELAIDGFSVVAISGGGPYAARLIARVPERVASIHLAAATAGGAALAQAAAERLGTIEAIARDPEAFWEYPSESAVHAIPGFMAAARTEGRQALGDAAKARAALGHELALLSSAELPDLGAARAPAYLYWGEDDMLVGLEHMRAWQRALGRGGVARVYPGIGHDVQYLRWPAILRDIQKAA